MSAFGPEDTPPGGEVVAPAPARGDAHAPACQVPAATDVGSGAAPPDTDTLFYDGQCPLCASEIDSLRKSRGDALRLVDIHSLDSSVIGAAPDRPDKDRLLRALHLQRADGSWLTGADANVAAWEGTAHEGRLRPLRWPLLRHLVDFGYLLWAKWRYWRLYGRQFDENRHAPDQAGH